MLIVYPDRTQVFSSPLPELSTNGELETSVSNPYISMPSNYGRNLFFLVSSTTEREIEIYNSYAELLRIYPNVDNTDSVKFAAVRGTKLYYQGYPSTAETLIAYYYRKPTDMSVYTAATISFAESGSRIADTADGFSGFSAGQIIDVTGTSDNNTDFTISAVADDYSYITTVETPTDEAAGDSITIKSRPHGIPEHLQESLLENYCAWKIFERKTKNDVPMDVDAKRYHGLFLGAMISLEAAIETVPGSIQFLNDPYA
jgi:hypothetical protein